MHRKLGLVCVVPVDGGRCAKLNGSCDRFGWESTETRCYSGISPMVKKEVVE